MTSCITEYTAGGGGSGFFGIGGGGSGFFGIGGGGGAGREVKD